MASANGFTGATADCYNAELNRQGERLERAYDAARSALSGDEQARLLEAQGSWVVLRDSRCQQNPSGDTILREGSCRLDMTIQRAIELERLAR